MNYSPLRYPGGKNKLSAFIAKICVDNNTAGHYIEPYCGGSAVALFLLFEGFVKRITINDKDRAIFAFWHSVLHKNEELCRLIETSEVTIAEWQKQKSVQSRKKTSKLLDLGFSTFFLNRTNRSGILNGGVIGGYAQKGEYLMNCRFNKQELINRIRKIAERKKDITLKNLDAIDLIDFIEETTNDNSNTILYFDPPYYNKASSLYMNYYQESNHADLSMRIQKIRNIKWIVSYDNVPEIKLLYSAFPKKEFSLQHSVYEIRDGKEILFFSPNIKQPEISNWNPLNFQIKKKMRISSIEYKLQ